MIDGEKLSFISPASCIPSLAMHCKMRLSLLKNRRSDKAIDYREREKSGKHGVHSH